MEKRMFLKSSDFRREQKHFKSLYPTQDKCEILTKASATASSTSEPVFKTRIALTDEDNLLDWLIPKPVPVTTKQMNVKNSVRIAMWDVIATLT